MQWFAPFHFMRGKFFFAILAPAEVEANSVHVEPGESAIKNLSKRSVGNSWRKMLSAPVAAARDFATGRPCRLEVMIAHLSEHSCGLSKLFHIVAIHVDAFYFL